MNFQVVEVLPEHIDQVSMRARQPDVEELWAAFAVTFREGLRASVEHAEYSRTWLIGGIPAAIGGTTRLSPRVGTIWLLCADLIEQHQTAFLRASRRAVHNAQREFEMLYNYVDVRNELAIGWLSWLGFHFDHDPVPYGVFHKPFLYFHWERKS